MSATNRFSGSGGYPLRPVSADSNQPVERAVSSTSVVELAGEPSSTRELRISPDGAVVSSSPVEELFSGALSYGARLGTLVGELLGMDRLVAVDMQFKNQRWAMVVSDNGDVVARQVSGQDDLKKFRARFGRKDS
ncbi:MAG: hypothetical protein SF187_30655 [Deltaproteobacteria bacterium]|nr:hypothetical protein [Deltaproteobacteria bacterium]